MRAIIEARTDSATVCFFDPVALPVDFDERAKKDPVEVVQKLAKQGRIWCWDTGADGGYLFHFYVDEEVPKRIQTHALEPQQLSGFHVPSGTLWACGTEYAARDPGQAGLDKFTHMGQKFNLPAGDYAVTVWRTEWPDQAIEQELERRSPKGLPKWANLLGTLTGVLFVVTFLATIAAAIKTLPLLWRGGWTSDVAVVWAGLGVAWLVCVLLMAVLNRIEKNPARREVEREFPSIVVLMRGPSA
jgi:hypothetical protein